MNEIQQVVIIGSGPAGLTAGIYAARAQLAPIIIEGKEPGGQLMGTTFVENWPGVNSILGPDLMLAMRAQAIAAGCVVTPGNLQTIIKSESYFEITTSTNQTFQTKTVIIATGAFPKKLNCPGEDVYWGKGVTSCAVCDGALYKDQPVVVVGGGDSAMEAASFLSHFTKNVTVIQILPHLTASKTMQQKVQATKTNFLFNATVTKILGNNDHVTGVMVTQPGKSQDLLIETRGVFLAIGLHPNSDPFTHLVQVDTHGYIVKKNQTETSIPGIFVAGDVADPRYRQAITSAGSGCMAALDAEQYLRNLGHF